ncbi:hypothetical protein FOXG_18472 [Fusarium oxysporum f. sp. lycopersici 4287]|uniref:Uncharacterized protein n=1 Tax=Fusarium oxysporum f. sp. lycopersici (strain 4287 / CBS 123668 / FGSC 9935 / NRRL 34936) TaxID=426428 RepID=A0A0J9UL28_FUSO4|nr:hypothetical protein FOXG_18472 [Fusarium oxysporum f. sp. lycopersici 4287]KNA98850.1 hypothetical protein FOXG_18472 [Fusarium oxysporum f. sp. lycopersici 4287]
MSSVELPQFVSPNPPGHRKPAQNWTSYSSAARYKLAIITLYSASSKTARKPHVAYIWDFSLGLLLINCLSNSPLFSFHSRPSLLPSRPSSCMTFPDAQFIQQHLHDPYHLNLVPRKLPHRPLSILPGLWDLCAYRRISGFDGRLRERSRRCEFKS